MAFHPPKGIRRRFDFPIRYAINPGELAVNFIIKIIVIDGRFGLHPEIGQFLEQRCKWTFFRFSIVFLRRDPWNKESQSRSAQYCS